MKSSRGVLCWNCRGAGGRAFAIEIKEMIREHRPKIAIILEPRISREVADQVYMNFREEEVVEIRGSWVQWRGVGFLG